MDTDYDIYEIALVRGPGSQLDKGDSRARLVGGLVVLADARVDDQGYGPIGARRIRTRLEAMGVHRIKNVHHFYEGLRLNEDFTQ